MTNQEAKNWIEDLISEMKEETSGNYSDPEYRDEVYKALDMAIDALEQESSVDLVSRQAVFNILLKYTLGESRIAEELRALPPVNLQEPSVEIVKTEDSNDNDTKYLNINVSDGEVKRNPDVVRLCSDAGILEYVKSKTGHWIKFVVNGQHKIRCDKCDYTEPEYVTHIRNYCPNCRARMV